MELDDIDFDFESGAGMSAGFPTVGGGHADSTVEFADSGLSAGAEKRARMAAAKARRKAKSGGFETLGLSGEVFRGIMRLGYKIPTPIQRRALPIALAGNDLCAMARTGSGKTAAFLVPLLESLKKHCTQPVGARAVILSPTRELATQTMKFAKKMAKFTDLRMCLLVGGATMNSQFSSLATNPDIIVATPGRLMHLLQEVADFRLNRVQFVVFDEADRLFEMGFAEQIKEILAGMPTTRQTMLFSATMPKQLMEFARAGLKDPEIVRLDVESTISDKLKLGFFTVRTEEKLAMLLWVLEVLLPEEQQAIIFTCTRHHVEFVHNLLLKSGVSSAPIYGLLDQAARKINLAKFRARKCRCLVVTDVAARGIDIPYLDNVINFDFPDKPKLFVHRVGRVARQGRPGAAFSFVAPKEVPYMIDCCLFIARKIENTHLSADGQPTGYTLEEMTPEFVHYGKALPMALAPHLESVSSSIRNNYELQNMKRTADNAYKQFNKTRGEASRRSVARAKGMSLDRIHPLMIGDGKSTASLTTYLDGLSSFRPTQTILEVDASKKVASSASAHMADVRRKNDPLIRAKRTGVTTMTAELGLDLEDEHAAAAAAAGDGDGDGDGAHGGDAAEKAQRPTIANDPLGLFSKPKGQPRKRLSKAQRANLRKNNKQASSKNANAGSQWHVQSSKAEQREYKRQAEKAQFISMTRPDAAKEQALAIRQRDRALGAVARLEESVLDLTPDETRAFLASKRIMRWDKRKKKYIKSTLAEMTGSKRKRYKTADGTILGEDGKAVGRLYDQWKKKTKRRVGEEDFDAIGDGAMEVFSGAGGGMGAGGAAAKHELQSEAKLRKERTKAARLAAQRAKRKSANSAAAKRKGIEKKGKRAASKIKRGMAPTRAKMIVQRGPAKKKRRG